MYGEWKSTGAQPEIPGSDLRLRARVPAQTFAKEENFPVRASPILFSGSEVNGITNVC